MDQAVLVAVCYLCRAALGAFVGGQAGSWVRYIEGKLSLVVLGRREGLGLEGEG